MIEIIFSTFFDFFFVSLLGILFSLSIFLRIMATKLLSSA